MHGGATEGNCARNSLPSHICAAVLLMKTGSVVLKSIYRPAANLSSTNSNLIIFAKSNCWMLRALIGWVGFWSPIRFVESRKSLWSGDLSISLCKVGILLMCDHVSLRDSISLSQRLCNNVAEEEQASNVFDSNAISPLELFAELAYPLPVLGLDSSASERAVWLWQGRVIDGLDSDESLSDKLEVELDDSLDADSIWSKARSGNSRGDALLPGAPSLRSEISRLWSSSLCLVRFLTLRRPLSSGIENVESPEILIVFTKGPSNHRYCDSRHHCLTEQVASGHTTKSSS